MARTIRLSALAGSQVILLRQVLHDLEAERWRFWVQGGVEQDGVYKIIQ